LFLINFAVLQRYADSPEQAIRYLIQLVLKSLAIYVLVFTFATLPLQGNGSENKQKTE